MIRLPYAALLVCMLPASILGCGSGSTQSTNPPPPTGACSGVAVGGVLQDSLTGHAVAQGWVFLEAGKALSGSTLYNFSVAERTLSDTSGKFALCVPAVSSPSVLVALALDSSGNAYPPFVTSVTGPMNLTIPMGSCAVLCGLPGQQQTSAPAVISGTITTDPIAASGTVTAVYAIDALDGSRNVWNIAVPAISMSQTSTFTTVSGTCPAKAAFCASYSFTLPSQKPRLSAPSGYIQGAGAPTYSIYASATGATCTPPFAFTAFEQDGATPLTAAPGARLAAANLIFSVCRQ